MYLYQYLKTTGVITRIVYTLESTETVESLSDDAHSVVAYIKFYGDQHYYVCDGAMMAYPPKPTEFILYDWTGSEWVPNHQSCCVEAIQRRTQLLLESDWTDTVSAQTRLGSKYAEWQAYRQALRDITAQPGYPTNITWPTMPT